MYIIKFNNKRFNNKLFDSYEAARKYVRRKVTERFGSYRDDYTSLGFKIQGISK